MGIKSLSQLITEESPKAITRFEMKTLFGRKVAIDASMSIYQFLIAVRQKDGEMLQNEAGETTSHLMGFFYRTLRMIDNGIKPMYVFDGKPPDLKSGVLKSRFAGRQDAIAKGEEQKETADVETLDKLSRRTVKVTREHNEECRRLLQLMGIPVVIAPSEAEAQCAELARGGKVYAAGSEDMDTLTFNAPILLRHLTFSEAKKEPISMYDLPRILQDFNMSREQFTDLCILLGCDYLEPIKGVGPATALRLMREHGSLEKIVEFIRDQEPKEEEKVVPESEDEASDYATSVIDDSNNFESMDEEESGAKPVIRKESPKKSKPKPTKAASKKKGGFRIPEHWPFEEARQLFLNPEVTPASELELEWKAPDVDGLIQFLVNEKGFSEARVRSGADRLSKSLQVKQQGRLDGFFKAVPKTEEQLKREKQNADQASSQKGKRKGPAGATGKNKKAKK